MEANRGTSRLLNELQETMQGLRHAGLITKRSLDHFQQGLDLEVETLSPERIRALREQARVSQSVFAAMLNTSVSTVRKWEQGDKHPSGPSLKLLNLVARKGLEILL